MAALKDTADMLFVFLAIAVGLTVGAGAATAAATLSVVFNLVVLALWHCDDAIACEATAAAGLPAPADERLVASDSPRRLEAKKERKKRRYTGVLSVQVSDVERGKPLVLSPPSRSRASIAAPSADGTFAPDVDSPFR